MTSQYARYRALIVFMCLCFAGCSGEIDSSRRATEAMSPETESVDDGHPLETLLSSEGDAIQPDAQARGTDACLSAAELPPTTDLPFDRKVAPNLPSGHVEPGITAAGSVTAKDAANADQDKPKLLPRFERHPERPIHIADACLESAAYKAPELTLTLEGNPPTSGDSLDFLLVFSKEPVSIGEKRILDYAAMSGGPVSYSTGGPGILIVGALQGTTPDTVGGFLVRITRAPDWKQTITLDLQHVMSLLPHEAVTGRGWLLGSFVESDTVERSNTFAIAADFDQGEEIPGESLITMDVSASTSVPAFYCPPAARGKRYQVHLSSVVGAADPSRNSADNSTSRQVHRVWTDATGEYRITARFVSLNGETVTLQREDTGKEIEISLSKLSASDRAVVYDIRKQP
jgi:hypothetical protein